MSTYEHSVKIRNRKQQNQKKQQQNQKLKQKIQEYSTKKKSALSNNSSNSVSKTSAVNHENIYATLPNNGELKKISEANEQSSTLYFNEYKSKDASVFTVENNKDVYSKRTYSKNAKKKEQIGSELNSGRGISMCIDNSEAKEDYMYVCDEPRKEENVRKKQDLLPPLIAIARTPTKTSDYDSKIPVDVNQTDKLSFGSAKIARNNNKEKFGDKELSSLRRSAPGMKSSTNEHAKVYYSYEFDDRDVIFAN
jgi:hypothetical protein